MKPRTQWKYLVILAAVMILCAALCYYAFLISFERVPGIELLDEQTLKNFKKAFAGGFFGIMLAFTVFVLVQSVFYFHRIMGPLFLFEKVMKEMSEGNFAVEMHLRKKDEPRELAFLIGKTIDNTKASVIKDRETIAAALDAFENGDAEKAKELLSSVTKWCKTETFGENKND